MKKIICYLFIVGMFVSCSEDVLDPFLPGVCFEEQLQGPLQNFKCSVKTL
jgi:hypothetical protein